MNGGCPEGLNVILKNGQKQNMIRIIGNIWEKDVMVIFFIKKKKKIN
jgi:hypothetical protein